MTCVTGRCDREYTDIGRAGGRTCILGVVQPLKTHRKVGAFFIA